MARWKTFRTETFTSPSQAYVAGGQKLDFNGWVPNAKDGKRVIIDGFEIHFPCSVTLNDSGTDPWLAEDVWRVIDSLTIEQKKDAVKRYDELSGSDLRVFNYAVLDPGDVREAADMADGATYATQHFTFYVPMAKPAVSDNPYEYSMAAEVFKNLRLGPSKDANLSIGGAGSDSVVINSGTYYIVAICHLEEQVILHGVDTVVASDFQSQLQTTLVCSGRPMDLVVYIPGAGGGTALSWTSATFQIIDVYDQSRDKTDLMVEYAREHHVQPGLSSVRTGAPIHVNPFVPAGVPNTGGISPLALALLTSTGNHPDEGQARDSLSIKSTQSSNLGTLRAIMREVVPRSAALTSAVAKKWGATHTVPNRDASKKRIKAADAQYFSAKAGK